MKRIQESRALFRVPRTLYLIVAVLIIGIVLTLLNVWELRKLQQEHFVSDRHTVLSSVEADSFSGSGRPVVWVKANNVNGVIRTLCTIPITEGSYGKLCFILTSAKVYFSSFFLLML